MISFVFDKMTSMGDALLGRGEHAVTVPPMDGALQPNQALEEARSALRIPQPDNLAVAGDRLYITSADSLYRWRPESGTCELLHKFEAVITSVATLADDTVAVSTDDGCIRLIGGEWSGRLISKIGAYRALCPTAMLGFGDHQLIVAEGSARHRCSGWRHDLMSGEKSGSVWLLDLKQSSARCLSRGLGHPNGLAIHPDGGVVVSESWRHRLLRVPFDGGSSVVMVADLPGYPGRMTPAKDGGYWLCVFAPRSQLVEFVLREPKFLNRMMAEIPEGYWVAPALSAGRDFKEPLQGGAIKSMGILKPWAPTRSYGLVVRLDAGFAPVSSMHSRADGHRHGITSAVEWNGELLISSRGGDEVIATPIR
jgi:hypothetical protein